MRLMVRVTMSLCVIASWTHRTSAEDWPQFRGETGMGLTSESDLPTKWSPSDRILWAAKLTGRGNSSPAVTGRNVVLTTQEDDGSMWVVSLDRNSGTTKLKVRVGHGTLAATGAKNLYSARHNVATPSPIADERRIWAFFGSGQLVCLDANTGNVVWQHDMPSEYGAYDIAFGMASTPRLWRDSIYVVCMTKGPSYVIAFDKLTGAEKWKAKRRFLAHDDGLDGYSSPTVYVRNGVEALLVSGADHVNAYDLESGRELWASDGLSIDSPYGRVIASAVEADGIIVATSANPQGGGVGHVIAFPSNLSGTISSSARLWRFAKSTADASTPVCVGGNVFMVSENGIGTCLDLTTGRVHWQHRLASGPYYASAVAGDGKVYFLSIDGTCSVVEANSQFRERSQNKLAGTFYATPAISDGTIFLRAHERLYAIR